MSRQIYRPLDHLICPFRACIQYFSLDAYQLAIYILFVRYIFFKKFKFLVEKLVATIEIGFQLQDTGKKHMNAVPYIFLSEILFRDELYVKLLKCVGYESSL